ncbi:COP9 signalosome complex subunit 7 [Acorus calamus]|uniref:COP9 signalosome complex subunit 7 n=1 Tax=Acorus calamus TaxID=4465 RepID=A0AAV9DU70_ACOCL|nr:COP9 signalosome complex subunit 7 [Acorus calamus]
MDIEQKQAELIEQYVKRAETLTGPSLAGLIVEATSHPSLFAFAEILSVPNLSKIEGTQYSRYLDMLRLFAHGTWSDYKSNADSLPALVHDQIRKLKQLSVLTLAETNKELSYDQLMQELDVSNVRELEDFLINECMYSVQFAAGRDLSPGQLSNMIETLTSWLSMSDSLLHSIQEKIKWADIMSEADKKHRKDIEDKVEEVKKHMKADVL